MTGVVSDAGNIVIQVTFWTALLCTPVVSLWWPWWLHAIGRTVAVEAFAIAVVLAPAVWHEWTHADVDTLPFAWFRVCCVATVPLILIWRVIAIYLTQRDGTRRRQHERNA